MATKGQITLTILPDGTVKIETGDLSGPLHKTADDFIKAVENALGGETTAQSTKHGHVHAHDELHTETHIKS